MMLHERVETRPDVMFGQLAIRGTRIPVELILRKLAAREKAEEILGQHPRLRSEDIYAVHAYIAGVLVGDEVAFNPDHS
jgi:uncharacterized protein (DUF433 family)